ncbi:MAG TPA: site-specific tyrosine recombinase/integron integrase [Chitinophagales bacterium]|nr:site-specific tyrosine recombinase/integron integrase [Chitinophagales bacterium]
MYLDTFISYLKHEKRYSPHTVQSYQNDLAQFHHFLKEKCAVETPVAVSHFHIRSWMASLMENKISPRSINRKISSLKSFFKFLRKTGEVAVNPMLKVVAPKISRRLPAYVEKSDTEKLLKHTEFKEGFSGKRDKLIFEILYLTGIRLSELVNLKETDIDRGRKEMKVVGKGNKQRVIPLHQNLLESISEYLALKAEKYQSEYLIVTDSGKKLYPKFVYRTVNFYLGKVTTVEKKSPHTMRHTFATHLVDNGAELNAVKELLGHSSLAATQVYTHNSIEKLKETYKKAHPKA